MGVFVELEVGVVAVREKSWKMKKRERRRLEGSEEKGNKQQSRERYISSWPRCKLIYFSTFPWSQRRK